MTQDTHTASGAADLRDTLINIAREIEALKRECGMDPESPIAIQNGRYMALSYKVRALARQATAVQQGVAYAALPDECDSQEICAISKTCAGQFGTKRICASHGQAPAGESLRTDALCDLSYSHGLKAGWNYCASDDLAGFERAQKIGAEALRTLKSPTAQAAPEGWVTWWPSPSAAGHEPVYSHGPKEPGYGAKLDAMLRKYPVFAKPTTQPAPQQEAQEPYSIDADPQGIRAIVADAITGVLAFGAQGTNAPPDGHWLAPFWAAARAEREAAPQQEAQEPMAWHEQARAIREGNEIAASDKYFSARPQIVSADRRKVFRAGFERGWDAACAAQEDKTP